MISILASIAEEESKSIAANNRWAIQKRFKDGSYRRGVAPYGYDLVDGGLMINETEAETVRFIFDRMLCGMPAWMPEAWSKLSEDNQKQASSFLLFLLSQQGEAVVAHTELGATAVEPKERAKRKLGILADRFISMSEDFNEPFEGAKECSGYEGDED